MAHSSGQYLVLFVLVCRHFFPVGTACPSLSHDGAADAVKGIEVLFPPHQSLVRCRGNPTQPITVKYALSTELLERDTFVQLFWDGNELVRTAHPQNTGTGQWIMVKGIEYFEKHIVEIRSGAFSGSAHFFLDRLEDSGTSSLECTAWASKVGDYDPGEPGFLAESGAYSQDEERVFSDTGEEGVLQALMTEVGPGNRTFMAIGGVEVNSITKQLLDSADWQSLEVDSERLGRLNGQDTRNLDVDLLSFGANVHAYSTWLAMNESIRPRIVVSTYNAWFSPREYCVLKHINNTCQGSQQCSAQPGSLDFGLAMQPDASLLALTDLAQRKGYALVYAETHGLKCFFVRNDLVPRLRSVPHLNDVAATHALVKFMPCFPAWRGDVQCQTVLPRGDHGAGLQASDEPGGEDADLKERMDAFASVVCSKCRRRGIDCGCADRTLGSPVELLRAYARKYSQWRRMVEHGKGEEVKWVLVDVEGGAGNQLIQMAGALLVAVATGRALAINTNSPMTYRFDGVLDLFEEEALRSIPEVQRIKQHQNSTYVLNLFKLGGVEVVTCRSWANEFERFPFVKFIGAFGMHLPLVNDGVGPWLSHAFRMKPCFFLFHFLWSGSRLRDRKVLVESLPQRKPWDGVRTVEEIGATLRAFVGSESGGQLVGVHVRTDTNHPMFYFDQTHLLPDHPRGFCGGHPSSLASMGRCVEATVATSTVPGTEPVLVWVTDNDELSLPLLQSLASKMTVVRVRHPNADRHDVNCQQWGCEEGGLLDMELLGQVEVLVGSPGSTFSFVAHARGLVTPRYGSFVPHPAPDPPGKGAGHPGSNAWGGEEEAGQCGATGGTESGLLVQHRGLMHSRCQILQGMSPPRVECQGVRAGCTAGFAAHYHLGKCLEDGVWCKAGAAGREGGGGGGFSEWARQFAAAVDLSGMMQSFYARYGYAFRSTLKVQRVPRCLDGDRYEWSAEAVDVAARASGGSAFDPGRVLGKRWGALAAISGSGPDRNAGWAPLRSNSPVHVAVFALAGPRHVSSVRVISGFGREEQRAGTLRLWSSASRYDALTGLPIQGAAYLAKKAEWNPVPGEGEEEAPGTWVWVFANAVTATAFRLEAGVRPTAGVVAFVINQFQAMSLNTDPPPSSEEPADPDASPSLAVLCPEEGSDLLRRRDDGTTPTTICVRVTDAAVYGGAEVGLLFAVDSVQVGAMPLQDKTAWPVCCNVTGIPFGQHEALVRLVVDGRLAMSATVSFRVAPFFPDSALRRDASATAATADVSVPRRRRTVCISIISSNALFLVYQVRAWRRWCQDELEFIAVLHYNPRLRDGVWDGPSGRFNSSLIASVCRELGVRLVRVTLDVQMAGFNHALVLEWVWWNLVLPEYTGKDVTLVITENDVFPVTSFSAYELLGRGRCPLGGFSLTSAPSGWERGGQPAELLHLDPGLMIMDMKTLPEPETLSFWPLKYRTQEGSEVIADSAASSFLYLHRWAATASSGSGWASPGVTADEAARIREFVVESSASLEDFDPSGYSDLARQHPAFLPGWERRGPDAEVEGGGAGGEGGGGVAACWVPEALDVEVPEWLPRGCGGDGEEAEEREADGVARHPATPRLSRAQRLYCTHIATEGGRSSGPRREAAEREFQVSTKGRSGGPFVHTGCGSGWCDAHAEWSEVLRRLANAEATLQLIQARFGCECVHCGVSLAMERQRFDHGMPRCPLVRAPECVGAGGDTSGPQSQC